VNRSSFFEGNYSQFIGTAWPLTRIDAIRADSDEIKKTFGSLTSSEKACFISHKLALKMAVNSEGHAYILEDDAKFGSYSFNLINDCLNQLEGQDWDILYTDVSIPQPKSMVEFFLLRSELVKVGRWQLLNLASINFAGATAYIINSKSKAKLADALGGLNQLNVPYDLMLRNWIQQGVLKAFSIFPFASTLSKFADQSQIQPQGTQATEFAWNSFRRLVWVGCQVDPLDLSMLEKSMDLCASDERSKALGSIVSVITSIHIVNK